MKKIKIFGILFLMMCFVSACGNSNVSGDSAADRNSTNVAKSTQQDAPVDFDLVKLKGNMLQAQLQNMLDDMQNNPTTYIGKRMRLIGNMGIMDGMGEKKYFSVSTADPTNCCTAAIEFVLKGGSEKVEDYPVAGKKVRVSGIIQSYKEGNTTYYHLVDSDVYVFRDK